MRAVEQMGGTVEQPEEQGRMDGEIQERRGMVEPEKEQTREEIEVYIKEAFEKQLLLDLVIENSDGPSFTPDCLIEEMEGERLMVTYIAEDGDLGEVIPVSLSRIKNVILKEPFQGKN